MMGGVTEWVRRALAELGPDAPDAEVKAYIRANNLSLPERQIGLALRKLRGRAVPARKPSSRAPAEKP